MSRVSLDDRLNTLAPTEYISPIWFKIVDFVSSEKTLRDRYKSTVWLFDLLEIIPPKQRTSETLGGIRAQFNQDPNLVMKRIVAFAEDLHLQEVSRRTLKSIEGADIKFWEDLGTRLAGYSTDLVDNTREARWKTIMTESWTTHTSSDSSSMGFKVSQNAIRFMESHAQEYGRLTYFASDIHWKTYLHKQFAELKDRGYDSLIERLSEIFWRSDLKESPATKLEIQFRTNLCRLAEAITGQRDVNSHLEAIKILWDSCEARSRYTDLYKRISDQDTTIAEQRRIITCLNYRHALEKLGTWKKLWTAAVQAEADQLWTERSANSQTERHLTPVLKYQFETWYKYTKPKPTRSPQLNDYMAWPGYVRGLGFFGDLSNDIHRHGSEYEFSKTQWLKTDQVILELIKPKQAPGQDVDWANEVARISKGTPNT
ncbi:hypothetical protein EJ05DRAFT_212156 [Pseudovirgaria hyperparasitica]|uniref:Uncharacterized protein n=1 Tax=Pseudovirgaria hyperparasitica TaxID=470096 RepID=A0A6A6VT69_9PEZI|nr:uncharacterized protein EJ05DRAFT_212156 [Pseudovirgaria hyperparasitica]KAF2753345.1 hypothetical protein EJ05DRAFT_212156 [Pseudovirgaria hyperparasitica]